MKRVIGRMGLIARATCVLPLLMVVAGGCATGPSLDMNKVADKFYSQNRTYRVLEMKNVDKIVLEGKGMELAVTGEMQPLSVVPRDPEITGQIAEAAKDIALGGLGIWTAGSTIKSLGQQPRVIETRPEIVRPEIIQVPAQ